MRVGPSLAARLEGEPLPALQFPSSRGVVHLTERPGRYVVLYVYPRTAVAGERDPRGWDRIPGARGCTAEACSFRDHERELSKLGARVMGLSSQVLEQQRRFATRASIPYPLLSDPGFLLAGALGLPTLEVAGRRFYERLTIISDGSITKIFHPVAKPETHGAEVLAWLRSDANDAA
ncbi:MAG: peroxiredoxin [Gaiellaceae bacterium]